jgi:FERM/RhoGEF/pleckstrin domain protein 2
MLIICEIHIYRAEPVILTVKKSARGLSLWEELLRHVHITDSQYFGLQFTNNGNRKCWLDMHNKVGKQLEGGGYRDAFPLDLRVKFWPTDAREVKDELVRCLLAVELHEWLQQGRLKCEHQTLVHIGALTLQSQLGDYDSFRHRRGYASHFCISCNQTAKLEADMESLHQTDFCREMTPMECDHGILEVAQKIPLYGVHQFPAMDKKGRGIGLGLGCNGVLVLAQETIVNQFVWSAIKKSFIVGRTFFIELHPHRQGERLVQVGFTMDLAEVAKEFWKLCLDFHAFYQCFESMADEGSVGCQVWRPRLRYHCSGSAYNRMMLERRHSFCVGASSQFQQMLRPSSLR